MPETLGPGLKDAGFLSEQGSYSEILALTRRDLQLGVTVARVLERSNSGRNSSVLQSLGKSKSIYLVHSVMTGEPSSDIFVI